MLHEFIETHRDALVERCRLKVGRRSPPPPAPKDQGKDIDNGISSFVGQLIDTLRLEQFSLRSNNRVVAGPWRSEARDMPTQIASTATSNGGDMFRQGFTLAQVVDDYGDLCQAVMELAIEKGVSISAREFLTLNRCLDVAMADAVTEFSRQRDRMNGEARDRTIGERLGTLAHDLRDHVNTAMLAYKAIKEGGVGLQGATSAVLQRSLAGLRERIDLSLADVRLAAGAAANLAYVDLEAFIADVQVASRLEAAAKGCELVVTCEPGLAVEVDNQMLLSAVSNLLQNAFKFTCLGSEVALDVRSAGERVLIEVEDRCGGLPEGTVEAMFAAFEQFAADRSGLGLGLSIARRAVEANAGSLRVRDKPGIGCVFTIELPRVRYRTDEPVEVG